MIRILFICHGNICRSPMAEFVLKHYIKLLGAEDSFKIESAATSQEEIGNGVYPPVKAYLAKVLPDTDTSKKRARQISREDCRDFDYIIAMEKFNLENLFYLRPEIDRKKVFLLLDFTPEKGDIDDPWYTRRFDIAYNDISRGCLGLLSYLNENRADGLKLDADALKKLQ